VAVGDENSKVLFSENIGKINRTDTYQQRNFIVSDNNIYNFKGDSYERAQWRLPIRQLDGLVVSAQSREVVLQVRSEHDYHLDFTVQKSFVVLIILYVLCEHG
jgi:hypothetical protein